MQKSSLRSILLTGILFLLPMLPYATSAQDSGHKATKKEKKAALQLHTAAVLAYDQGISLDAPVPSDMKSKFPDKTVEKLSGKGPNGEALERVKTIREVLEGTEGTLASGNGEIHLIVDSAPAACSASYTPVIGGTTLDLGMTKVDEVVNPKFYVVNCACRGQVMKKTVDCTRSQRIVFACTNQQ